MIKGKLVVGQSGGPTAVINASLAGVLAAARRQAAFTAVYGLVHGIEGAINENFYDLGAETSETLALLKTTPAAALGSCRYKLTDRDYERILKVFQAHQVRYFVYIGGNDSMDTCQRISVMAQSQNYDLQVIGVPKTIDNDLVLTDHTPGFGSAARFFAQATRDVGRDLEAMETFDDVTILEVLGRNAGWLTAACSLGREQESEAPHLLYLPEQVFDEQKFLRDVVQVHSRLGRVFVAVCEGVRTSNGEFVGAAAMKDDQRDAFGHVLPTLMAGVGSYLVTLVRNNLHLQARSIRPMFIGRVSSACISLTDQREAYQLGKQAIHQLVAGESGYMVTLERVSDRPYEVINGLASLTEVANAEKLLPAEFIAPQGNQVTEAFKTYALPLIGSPLPPFARLKGVVVDKKVS